MRQLFGVLAVLALAACCALPAAAGAAARRFTVKGAPAPGPKRYDRTYVEAFGPRSAKRVLILVPGFQGGAGDFRLIGPEIVRRVRGLQVWAWDRREQAFEDTRGFDARNPDAALAYYLGGATLGGHRFTPVGASQAPFARDWGLNVELRDLRNVVLKASAGGRRQVILGGHSFGAASAMAYATWDFGGHAGWRDLTGLVLIDGAALSGRSPTRAGAQAQLTALRKSSPFSDLLGFGLPWIAGVFSELGGQSALLAPNAPSPVQQLALLPSQFKPPFPVTNDAELGYAFDAGTSPAALSLLHVDSGHLASSGDPRGWVDDGVTPIHRLAQILGTEPVNGSEWYFPQRLVIDLRGVTSLVPGPASRTLDLHATHLREVRLPMYAFQTSLSNGGVIRGVRRFVRRSRVPIARLVSAPGYNHLDPLAAAPAHNAMLSTIVPFLHSLR